MKLPQFQYPVTRNATEGRPSLMIVLSVLLGLYVVIITIVNIAATGYEPKPVQSSDYNQSIVLWYDKFVPSSSRKYTLDTWTCDPAVILVNDGTTPLSIQLI
jgi:hypothetical protein